MTVRGLRTSLSGACSFVVVGGVLSCPISHGSPMSKKSYSVPGLKSSFLGFLDFKKCLGARVSFGIPNYVYIGSRVDFG